MGLLLRFSGVRLAFFVSLLLAQSIYTQSLTSFRVANGTSGENPAVLWVGVDQGFYRKHGLDVEVIFMRTGPLAMSALASSDVQTVFTSSNNVLNVAAGGLDVVVIGNVVGRLEGDLMARPEIKKPEDLKASNSPFKASAAAVGLTTCWLWITWGSTPTATTSASSSSAINLHAFRRSKPDVRKLPGWARLSARR
jgi:ABC-type taurine transport system substrate-binding protein